MKSFTNPIIVAVRTFVTSWHAYLAAGLLVLMFGLGFTSMVRNSAIVDEVAHVPAAYSYLHYGDYRLNPEHPPLVKDIAGLPLQFMRLKFPDNREAWTSDVNGQWEAGWDFLYHLGNNADAVLFWSRLPILLLAIGFGAFLYWYVRRRWGTGAGLMTLLFYTLSPNILAHSSLVTTDLGASVFIFLAIITFARFVEKPTLANMFLLSLALAGAQLAKFSAVLLYPFLGAITLGLVWLGKNPKKAVDRLSTYTAGFITASGLSVLWIWVYYVPHTWNMPAAVQDRLIEGTLNWTGQWSLMQGLMNLNNLDIFKPLVHYILGLTMVFWRVKGGNVTYFNGEVTDQSFVGYFPQLFMMKTQVALLILLLAVVGFAVYRLFKRRSKRLAWIAEHFRTHVLEWSLGLFAAFYFVVSVKGNLNLGIRHILPVYIPLFILVAVVVSKRLGMVAARWRTGAAATVALLLVWYGGSTVMAHPSYLSYFNETIGGGANADKYFADSSVDWGQDLIRFKIYLEEHPEVNHVALDYFGGGVPEYYFCVRKFDEQGRLIDTAEGYECANSKVENWHSQYGPYTGQYIAVSETFLTNDIWYANLNGIPGYGYLRAKQPIAKIGNSIYLYKLK